MSTVKTITYTASTTVFTGTALDSLASSATLVAGWSSAVIDNTTNQFIDAMLAGRFKANASAPTIGQIQVWVGSLLDDTNYPDVFDGTSSAKTVTSADIRNSILKLGAIIATDATPSRIYEFAPISVAQLFGGIMPRKWWVWVTHSMATALNATGSSGGQCYYTGIKYTDT